jgi:hypothetical protein
MGMQPVQNTSDVRRCLGTGMHAYPIEKNLQSEDEEAAQVYSLGRLQLV